MRAEPSDQKRTMRYVRCVHTETKESQHRLQQCLVKEGRNWFLHRFQQLRSYYDEIESGHREEMPYTLQIVPGVFQLQKFHSTIIVSRVSMCVRCVYTWANRLTTNLNIGSICIKSRKEGIGFYVTFNSLGHIATR